MTLGNWDSWDRDYGHRDARRAYAAQHPLTFWVNRAQDCTVEEFAAWCDENLTGWLPVTLGWATVVSVETPADAYKLRTRWGCYMGLPPDRYTLEVES